MINDTINNASNPSRLDESVLLLLLPVQYPSRWIRVVATVPSHTVAACAEAPLSYSSRSPSPSFRCLHWPLLLAAATSTGEEPSCVLSGTTPRPSNDSTAKPFAAPAAPTDTSAEPSHERRSCASLTSAPNLDNLCEPGDPLGDPGGMGATPFASGTVGCPVSLPGPLPGMDWINLWPQNVAVSVRGTAPGALPLSSAPVSRLFIILNAASTMPMKVVPPRMIHRPATCTRRDEAGGVQRACEVSVGHGGAQQVCNVAGGRQLVGEAIEGGTNALHTVPLLLASKGCCR